MLVYEGNQGDRARIHVDTGSPKSPIIAITSFKELKCLGMFKIVFTYHFPL